MYKVRGSQGECVRPRPSETTVTSSTRQLLMSSEAGSHRGTGMDLQKNTWKRNRSSLIPGTFLFCTLYRQVNVTKHSLRGAINAPKNHGFVSSHVGLLSLSPDHSRRLPLLHIPLKFVLFKTFLFAPVRESGHNPIFHPLLFIVDTLIVSIPTS